jgi:hypothetical protein
MMGNYACVSPMPDAGKACRDSDECRGVCTVEAAQPETAAVGKCSADDYPCGCKQFVEDGKAQYPICID